MMLGNLSAHLKVQEKKPLQGHSGHLLKSVSHPMVARLMLACNGWGLTEFLDNVYIPYLKPEALEQAHIQTF